MEKKPRLFTVPGVALVLDIDDVSHFYVQMNMGTAHLIICFLSGGTFDGAFPNGNAMEIYQTLKKESSVKEGDPSLEYDPSY